MPPLQMKRFIPIVTILTLVTASLAEKPNIVWISCEDISPHIACFGDPHAITPNLDRLATEGVRYTHTFTTAGVCAPCRSGIITGMYQTTLGTQHMRGNARLPDQIVPFPAYLRQAGYYTSNNSKQDYQFETPKGVWDESSGRAHWRKRKDKDQPFFSVFNFTGCHESGIAGEAKYRSVTRNPRSQSKTGCLCLVYVPSLLPGYASGSRGLETQLRIDHSNGLLGRRTSRSIKRRWPL